MSTDVLAHPSAAGITHRREQLDRDRERLIAQLEREQLIPVSPPPNTAAGTP